MKKTHGPWKSFFLVPDDPSGDFLWVPPFRDYIAGFPIHTTITMSENIPITGGFSRMELSPDATSPPVSSSFDLKLARMSSSPSFSHSPPDTFKLPGRSRRPTKSETFKQLKPFASADIKICTFSPNLEHC